MFAYGSITQDKLMPPKKPISTAPDNTAARRRKQALAKLEKYFLDAHEGEEFSLDGQPTITPLLKNADGGIETILEALRAYDDDDARDFMALYDGLTPTDRQFVSLEEIAAASGIGSLRLGEIAQSAMFVAGKLKENLIFWSNAAEIVKTSVANAKTKRGVADREWALKKMGYIPLPKGTQINVPVQVNVNEKKPEQIAQAEVVYLDSGQRLRAIHEAVEARRLPAPKTEPIDVGGPLDAMQSRTAAQVEEQLSDARNELEAARTDFASQVAALREQQVVEHRELTSLSDSLPPSSNLRSSKESGV